MLKHLIALRLRSMLGGMVGKGRNGEYKKPKAGKLILFTILFGYIGIVFAGLATMFAIAVCGPFHSAGGDWAYFGLFSFVAFCVVFLFSIFETKSEIFECKDNELLLALPLRPRDIVISRVITVLLLNYVEALVVLAPAAIVYALIAGNIVNLLGFLVGIALIPLVATSLSAAVGYVLAVLSARSRHKNLVTTICSVLFLVVYFIGYFSLMGASNEIEETVLENPAVILSSLEFLRPIGLTMTWHPIATPVFILGSLGIAYLALSIISRSFIRIATENRGAKRVEYKAKTLKKSPIVVALARKEMRHYLTSSTYIVNTGIGFVFDILLAGFALIKRAEIAAIAAEIGFGTDVVAPALLGAFVMLIMMNFTSACTVSLEGKNLWIARSLPVSGRDVLTAKMVPHVVAATVFIIPASLILWIASGSAAWHLIFYFLIPMLANLMTAAFGVWLNMLLPKFDFINEMQVIKQSVSGFIAMFGQLIFGLMLVGVIVVPSLFLAPVAGYFLASVLLGGLFALFFALLRGPMAARFEKFPA